MREFIPTKGLKNVRELLALERAKAEYLFVLKVLARDQARNGRPLSAEWILKPPRAPASANLGDVADIRRPRTDGIEGEVPGRKRNRPR
jgi:hypothetical protein